MLKPLHRFDMKRLLAALAIVASGVLLCSCAGSNEKTVAVVGKTKISQATLNHWMTVTLGGDYRGAVGKTAPDGLVSDPVDYPRCISTAARILAQSGKGKQSDGQLRQKCRQLNAGIKEQALSYVLSVLWAIEEGKEIGSRVSEGEVTRRVRELANRDRYHGPLQFTRYLAQLRRTIGDERFLVKRNILENRFVERITKQAGHADDREEAAKAKVRLILKNNAKWTAKTDCSPGYLAWECKQYGSSKAVSPAPAVVIEELVSGA
jgi:hypothetical protein